MSLWAQSQNTAQITGTVIDASGSAVPGAEIKATNTDTDLVRTVESGAAGDYVLPNLPVGPYRVEVSKQGFSTYVQTGIVLQVSTNPTVDVTLKVGNVSEQISVEANAALVETQATGVGTVMERERVLELPLNGRVATDLIQYTGAVIPQGVAGNGGYPNTQQFVIAGGQAYGVAFYLDGSIFNNPWDLANMPLPFPDALQEFKVETSTLTANNGVHAGGTVTGVTRSGSNAFHGDAFDFFRNGDLNGKNFFAATRDSLKRNQFGGVIGGPVKKDKLFFFFGWQNTIIRQAPVANTAATFVPTAAMIAGNFSGCPTDYTTAILNTLPGGATGSLASQIHGGIIPPSLLDPAAHNLAEDLPAPTTSNPCGNTSYGLITDVNEDQYVARGDYQVSQKHSYFGRYIRSHYFRPPTMNFSPNNYLTSTGGALNDADQGWVAGDTYLFSATLVNQFRATVDRIGIHRYDDNYVSACDLGVELLYCGYVPHQSGFTVTGGFMVGPGTGGQAVAHTTPIQINDDISWVKGNHQINFGGGGEISKMLFDGNVYSQTNWTFPNMLSFILGQFSSNSLSLPNDLNLKKWFVDAYVQDTWKVTSRFTVNVGVRWEPFLPAQNISGSIYDFSMYNLINGIKSTQFANAPPGLLFPGDAGFAGNKSGENSEWALMAPRVALAWDPKGDGKTVFRASWGISYDYTAGELTVNAADAPPYGGTEIWSGTFSNPFATNPGGNIFPYTVNSSAPFAAGGIYIAMQPNMKTTQVNQWNATIQHQFGNDWLASVQYIGSEAAHLWDSYQLNPAVYIPGNCTAGEYGLTAPGPCSTTSNTNYRRVFVLDKYPGTLEANGTPTYGYVDTFDDGGTSSYNGLLLLLQKRISKGLLANVNYTWSHCIGDLNIGDSTGNAGAGYVIPGDRRYDRSNCQSNEIGGTFSSDRRQIFNATLVYRTPQLNNKLLNHVASDWVITGIYHAMSAYWLTVSLSTDVALTGAMVERPNLVLPNTLSATYGQGCAATSGSCVGWLNSAAFATPASGTFGNLGKNNIPGPAFWQLDLAIAKEFRIVENHKVEFRAEAFNVTNSFRAGIPEAPGAAGLAAGGSGVNTTIGTPTFGQITSALDPRIMQLALRYSF